MKHISPPPRIQLVDSNGDVAVGWKIYTYEAGSATPLATYTDSTGNTANQNPVVLDAYGSASVWLNNAFYKFIITDADDVTVWTVDNISWSYIFGDDNVWTGTNEFQGDVTLNTVLGDVEFAGSLTIDGSLYVVTDLTVDGTVTLTNIVADSITVPLITFSTGNTLSVTANVVTLTGKKNTEIITDNDGTPHTFDHREDGLLRLPVETPVDDLDAASKGYVDTTVTAALGSGLIAVASGAVVSNLLASGAVGVTSVNHTATGTYEITTDDSAGTTGKVICLTTVRNESPILTRGYTAYPYVVDVDQVRVQTGGGNSYSVADRDFNFVIYHLP